MSYAAKPPPRTSPGAARVAFVDSGIGLLGYADALRTLRPDVELVLSLDPDHMPYGPRTPTEVRELILASARAAAEDDPAAIVVACNTASVHGLEALRAEFEPRVPIIGTVPAIRPAASTGGPVAIWSTAATASSDYLRGLVEAFASDLETHSIAALGLAEAVEATDLAAIDRAIAAAVAQTPRHSVALVLGCTHYGLVADRIAIALARSGIDVSIFDSPEAVARQTLRRIGLEPDGEVAPSADPPTVLLSGRRGHLSERLAAYPQGARLLRWMPAAAPDATGPCGGGPGSA
ncbi:glutamate racemase [Intrasporangium sp.]|uniref:glutamate racemase n=1 Tax=Intrasporangium sp. TaxID=1925024 RepID=UPI00293AFF5D|nr:aspartate/glutamate racemase family protein [Intrasporangium sp.]MDV3222947.1 aspartate/glutamate racemase family protein [Intrasporangium sp.]